MSTNACRGYFIGIFLIKNLKAFQVLKYTSRSCKSKYQSLIYQTLVPIAEKKNIKKTQSLMVKKHRHLTTKAFWINRSLLDNQQA